MSGPLSGLRVLDLGTRIAAPFCAGLLGEQGAEVENFRPGTLEKWNIAPTDLDPKLVWVRISSLGQDGPSSLRLGLDRVGICYGGRLNLTGYPDRPPVRVGVTHLGLPHRGVRCPGRDRRALPMRRARIGQRRGDRRDALRIRAAHPRVDTPGVREARHSPPARGQSARQLLLLVHGDGPKDLLDDPRFTRLSDRAQHSDDINQIVAEWIATLPATEIEERCIATDVPVATAYTAAHIFADPHMVARGDIVTVDDPVAGPLRQQAPYPRRVGEPVEVPTGAPKLGEHADDVLTEWLGLAPDRIKQLRDQGGV